MKFNVQSSLMATWVLLVGFAIAAPIDNQAEGNIAVKDDIAKRQFGVLADPWGNPTATIPYIAETPTPLPATGDDKSALDIANEQKAKEDAGDA